MCQGFCSEIQKPTANNFAAIVFWPALLRISHRSGLGHCISTGSGNVSQVHALGMACVWKRCQMPQEPACPPALGPGRLPSLGTSRGNAEWVFGRVACRSRGWPELMAVSQPIHSSAQLQKTQISAPFRVTTSAYL